jgi:polyisoprenoid-binding protein YceI
MRPSLLFAGGGGVIAAGLLALAALADPPRKAPPAAPAAPVWVVDRAGSRLTFRGAVAGQGFDGVFKKWDGEIAFDPANLKASHATITIDLASVVTGDPTRDQMLPTPDWFAIARFPKASFTTTQIVRTGPTSFEAQGELRLKGASRRIAFPFTLTMVRDRAAVTGHAVLDRQWFAVGQGQFASADTVANEVTVTVRISATKAK